MGEANRPGNEPPPAEALPEAPPPGEDAGEAADGGWVIPGNVGSLDDVPAGTAGVPVAQG